MPGGTNPTTGAAAACQEQPESKSILDIIKVGSLVVVYITVSSCLIRSNKFLIHPDRFPYAMALTSLHMSVSFALCLGFYALSPSSFPGVARTEGQRLLVLRSCAPIAVCFAVALFCSNVPYLYCSVAFLQFMKEGNVIISFLFSVAAGLQVLTRTRVALIIWIVASSSTAVSGDLHFMWWGFAVQLVSQFAECLRNVMGEFLLSDSRVKLDPLSYTMFVAPSCLLLLLVGLAQTWDSKIPQAFGEWWHYLLPNAALAFALNLTVATIIKEVSAVGFVLAGLVKDIALVTASCLFFGEVVTPLQVASFIATLMGVFTWSYLKVSPDSGFALSLAYFFGDQPANLAKAALPSEKTALISRA